MAELVEIRIGAQSSERINVVIAATVTPATYTTLDRFIAKCVLHLGGDAGI